MFVAFPTGDAGITQTLPVVTAVIGYPPDFPPVVNWLETTSRYRRRGFASEVLAGLKRRLGPDLIADGVTKAGDAFLGHFERMEDVLLDEFDAVVQPRPRIGHRVNLADGS